MTSIGVTFYFYFIYFFFFFSGIINFLREKVIDLFLSILIYSKDKERRLAMYKILEL